MVLIWQGLYSFFCLGFLPDGDVCKDPVSTQYTVTVRPNARVAENDDALKEDERPHEASSSFKPTPGIEDLPASSAPSAESNSFSRNIFQKVYQEFIAPFGQEIELSVRKYERYTT